MKPSAPETFIPLPGSMDKVVQSTGAGVARTERIGMAEVTPTTCERAWERRGRQRTWVMSRGHPRRSWVGKLAQAHVLERAAGRNEVRTALGCADITARTEHVGP